MSVTLKELGQRLRNAREGANLTMDAVAAATGISARTLSRWETGRTEPGALKLAALAKLYASTMDQLVHAALASDGDLLVCERVLEAAERAADNGIRTQDLSRNLMRAPSLNAFWLLPGPVRLISGNEREEFTRRLQACLDTLNP